ncbi:sensor histidine kinase [Cochlodiniinecator piscidefendens]|uniref:sensor histidine kinase n=1 Tax=Cochlodiniinecator piscidefendens TaxID=2715756 RepID=UPI00197B46CA|nr:HAMP domain-containing sensor histidine kinase [Cochlodiniinecator piscidefendens]
MFLNSLSGRFLMLTVSFVMLAEVLIFVPSVARFREDFLLLHLERAQIASFALLAEDMLDEELEAELLENAGVFNVVLRRDEMRQLMLASPVPGPVTSTYDLRNASALRLMNDAISRLLRSEPEIIRVLGDPVREGGLMIEVTMTTAPLRAAIIDYGVRILVLSAVISGIAAFFLFFATRGLLVQPIRQVVFDMMNYSEAPEDARRIIQPSSRITELREAEDALLDLETQLTASLKQKERLAQLGGAVAKISHDLRNTLTVAQLIGDRIEMSEDPLVKRAAPKLLSSISRAVSLCEGTLAFGKAEEPAPTLSDVSLAAIASDVVQSETLTISDGSVEILSDVDDSYMLVADPEQMHRILTNLVRNARQAILSTGQNGTVTISGLDTEEEWQIHVTDTGPGLPPKAQENLFTPFQGGVRKGGTGLGLAIADELVRGHGGNVELTRTDSTGTEFVIRLPKGNNVLVTKSL